MKLLCCFGGNYTVKKTTRIATCMDKGYMLMEMERNMEGNLSGMAKDWMRRKEPP